MIESPVSLLPFSKYTFINHTNELCFGKRKLSSIFDSQPDARKIRREEIFTQEEDRAMGVTRSQQGDAESDSEYFDAVSDLPIMTAQPLSPPPSTIN